MKVTFFGIQACVSLEIGHGLPRLGVVAVALDVMRTLIKPVASVCLGAAQARRTAPSTLVLLIFAQSPVSTLPTAGALRHSSWQETARRRCQKSGPRAHAARSGPHQFALVRFAPRS